MRDTCPSLITFLGLSQKYLAKSKQLWSSLLRSFLHTWSEVSAAFELNPSVFCVITRRKVVWNRRFGTTYRCPHAVQGQGREAKALFSVFSFFLPFPSSLPTRRRRFTSEQPAGTRHIFFIPSLPNLPNPIAQRRSLWITFSYHGCPYQICIILGQLYPWRRDR